jgi:drug/metabolite transporter (DMT)-like permease
VLGAEQTVPSGVTALLVAVAPVGTLLLEWGMKQRSRPGPLTWLGLVLGLVGVVVLVVQPGQTGFPLLPTVLVLLGTVGWALGSNLSLKLSRPTSPIRAISSQMIVGSAILFILSALGGEAGRFHVQSVTLETAGALFYLVFVASIAAYIAYGFLIDHVSPTAAGTCSYVNPIVAMLLGGCFGEHMGTREFASLAIVLTGVALVSSQELRRSRFQIPVDESPVPMSAVPALTSTCS